MSAPPLAPKPSFRRRLFSHSSRKSAKASGESVALPVDHTAEISGSTNTTLTGELLSIGDDGQALASHTAESGSLRPASAPPSQDMQTDEIDRERGSLNTTLTGHNKPFYRRRSNKASASLGALSSSTSQSLVKSSKRRNRHKPSFLSRVVYKVVPCVGSDPSNPHGDNSGDDVPEKKRELQPMTEIPVTSGSASASNLVSHPDNPQIVIDEPSSSNSDVVIVPHIPIHGPLPPPSPTDSDIVVPLPPSVLLLPEDETDGVTSGAVQPPGSTGDPIVRTLTRDSSDSSDGTSFSEDEVQHMVDEQAEEERLIRNGGAGIPIGPDGVPRPLLPPIAPEHIGRKCLVLDLDETLVHSSFKAIQQPDFIVPVEIEYHWHHFHVLKRPGVDEFLRRMGEIYEVVVYTASLSKYADPVLDKLDIHQAVTHRLFRESCFNHKGNYVKDLSQLGRPIGDTIILDNSPASYIFHPKNAVPVSSWFNDPHDAELTDMIPFLADLTAVPDIRGILDDNLR